MDIALLVAIAVGATLPLAVRTVTEVGWGVVRAWRSARPGMSGALVLATALAGLARPAAAARPPASVTLEPPARAVGESDTDEDMSDEPAPAKHSAGVYVVEPGDSLWAIACRHLRANSGVEPGDAEVAEAWRHIYDTNRDVIGSDPNLIHPGQRLEIEL